MHLFSILLLAITVSFDSLAIGVVYGMSHIFVSNLARITLSIVSGIVFLLAMTIGSLALNWISLSHAQIIGGIILMGIGGYNIWRVNQPHERDPGLVELKEDKNWDNKCSLYMVLKEPLIADYDGSKSLSIQECLLLGFALSLDALASGVAAAVMGFSPSLAALAVMLANYLFVSFGLKHGKRWHNLLLKPEIKFVPGTIIILIGLIKIIF